MKMLPDAFQPRLGIASVEHWDEQEVLALLPEDSRLQPIDAAVEAKMEEILHARTFEATVMEAFRPRAGAGGLPSPHEFYSMREKLLQRLQELAPEAKDPAVAEDLRRAAALLQQQVQVHALGEQYRYALLKG